jgi:hypothetical protein
MCHRHSNPHLRNPLLCVTPPHILEEIARRGAAHHREWAIRTLAGSERLRGQRDVLGQMIGLFPSGGTDMRRTIFDAQGTRHFLERASAAKVIHRQVISK